MTRLFTTSLCQNLSTLAKLRQMNLRKARTPNLSSDRGRGDRLLQLRWWDIALLLSLLLVAGLNALLWWWPRPPKPFVAVVTLATAGDSQPPLRAYHEPYGIAADEDGNIFFSESVAGRIYRVPAAGYSKQSIADNNTIVAEGFDTPSAIAFDGDGNLIVANTGAHTIARIDFKANKWSIIAGRDGVSGFADGRGGAARFNGPVGIAVSDDGTIYVADTYNDRIRAISREGDVRTLAGGGEPGFRDGAGEEARFNTPCGIAVAGDGALLVADTGNHRIRRVEVDGRVTTFAGTESEAERAPFGAGFYRPAAIAVRDEESFYVADEGTIRLCTFGERESVKTLTAGESFGMFDDGLAKARLNRPAGLALLPGGELVFTDSGNGLLRAFVTANAKIGRRADAKSMIIQPDKMLAQLEPRWPFDPPDARRDIAGTFGEIRGERLSDQAAWFHTGIDVPGAYGETVRAVLTERVLLPLAVEDAGDGRERLRLPLFEYIHLRIGRDQNEQPIGNFAGGAVTFRRDEESRVIGIRLRRGTRINAGDPIGTLNQLNHIHLVAGPPACEVNALSVLRLPGLRDTVPPVIEAVAILNEMNEPANGPGKTVEVSGKLRIAARVYDQIDGNPGYRRLGVYRLGYQVLGANGSPAPGFTEPRYNIVFDRLPADPRAVYLTFADGSQSGYNGVTVFNYLVTNIVRGGNAREDFWDAARLEPGDYTLRVIAEDHFGNQARRDISVRVAARAIK
jgi:DNA-binding beta-propeller fold protein YncE